MRQDLLVRRRSRRNRHVLALTIYGLDPSRRFGKGSADRIEIMFGCLKHLRQVATRYDRCTKGLRAPGDYSTRANWRKP